MPQYVLNLLGGFDLTDPNGNTIAIRSKKGRCLLAYLALNQGQAVGRDTLAALLWGDRGDTQARRSLSQELYRLRGLFPEEAQESFILEAESVALEMNLFDVDAVRLESGESGAAALYTGDLLDGLSAGSEGFDEWLRDERERLRERAITALSADPGNAPESANRLLALDPANEEAHRALMRLHAEAGRRDLALKQYDKCRAHLAEELGIEPDGETRALLEEIKVAATPASKPATETAETPEPASPTEKAAERRQVTVIALGLVLESTGRGALDPEDRREVMRICRDVAAAFLERGESQIAKTLGDNLLAYFGYPEAREDDAERAARAGLEIVEAIAALDLPAGVRAQCRAGIASGLVIAGEGEAETLVGEAPDMAVRLLQAAAPGAIAVDAATRELLASAFALDALPDAGEAGTAWRLAGEAQTESRFAAQRSGALTPFVGRELELQALHHRWGQASEGEGQVVLISGEPGIGKSRIAETIHERLAGEDHLRLIYQCTPNHTNSALHPVIEQLTFAAGINADEAAGAKLDKLEALLAKAGGDTAEAAPLFADLLSIPYDGRYPPLNFTPQAQKDRTLEALVAQLTGLAKHQPVLFVFEDLHWADPTTRELLDLTVAAIEEARVLALFTFRPEYEAPWVGQANTTLMALTRLAKRQCGEMVRCVAAEAALPEDVLDDIVKKTDGVPLFVEELTKTMLAGGVDDGSGAAVPATIQASLTARLDQLGEAREVAQIAAVIGREFAYPLLAATVDMDEGELNARLEALTSSELVFARGAPPTASYIFKHALIRDAAYDSLLRPERRALHGRIAEALRAHFPATAANEPELLAHHHGNAGHAEQAIDYWRRAGERALERSVNIEACEHFRAGLALLEDSAAQTRSATELDLQIGLGSALTSFEGYSAPTTGAAYARARELALELGDEKRLAVVLYCLWNFDNVAARHDRSEKIAHELLNLTAGFDDTGPRLAAHSTLASSLGFTGSWIEAKQQADACIALYDPVEHASLKFDYAEDPCVQAHIVNSFCHWHLGYSDQAMASSNSAVELGRQLAHANSIGYALTTAPMLNFIRSDAPQTLATAEKSHEFCTAAGLPVWVGMAEVLRGWARAIADDPEGGIAEIQLGLSKWRGYGSEIMAPLCLTAYADASFKNEHYETALETIEETLSMMEESGEYFPVAQLNLLKAQILTKMAPGNTGEQEDWYIKALEIARAQGSRMMELRSATELARLWYGQGKTDEARELLAPLYDWFTEGFDTAYLMQAKALLDELG